MNQNSRIGWAKPSLHGGYRHQFCLVLILVTRFFNEKTCHQGVYISKIPLLAQVTLIVLNELSDEPHNAWIKCFSSRNLEKQKVFIALGKIKKGYLL